jgi:predicted RecB family nuclease
VRVERSEILLSPSDLTAHLACPHLTTLSTEVALGERRRPHTREALAELIAKKGDLHEARYLAFLREEGLDVREVDLPEGRDAFAAACEATVAAMHDGIKIIYQATFSREGWRGRADFLVRIDEPSDLGDWSYEPHDTKLARSAKPAAVLQLAWYSGEVAAVQGRQPERVHVVLGTREVETYRPADVDAYLRTAQRRLERHVEERPTTYPWPCEHCSRCEFTSVCRQQWVDDDHLTRVASIRRDQIAKLDTVEVTTLTALAQAPADLRVHRLTPDTLEALRDQAGLQLHRYREDEILVHLLEPDEKRGLGLLPEPSEGDLFFDMEGDPLFDPAEGLEFLFGVIWREVDGSTIYRAFWAHDRESECDAFAQFVDFVTKRRRAYPDLHVYHYAAYEPSTLARLMGTYATREEEVDQLLRGQVLVDLLQVVRQSLRAGVESYGLKDVEKLFFERTADVGSGNEAVIEFERWLDDRDQARLGAIAAYNEEDCLATLELRDWLLAQRDRAREQYGLEIPFLEPPEPYTPSEEETTETTELRDALLERGEGDWRELLARLLEYHKREARPAWWWHFARRKMTDDELADDGEAIGCLEHDGNEPIPVKKSLEWTFAFPPQEHHFDEGDHANDPRERGTGWTVSHIDNTTGTIRLRRSMALSEKPLPGSIMPDSPIGTGVQRAALRRLARSVLGGDGRYRHLERLLLREPPLGGESLQRLELEEQRSLLDRLADSYLVVQGPPGSGKTYRGARLITHLIRSGRKVGIVAQSHKVIDHLIDEIEEAADEEGLDFHGIKYGDHPFEKTAHVTAGKLADALDPNVKLVAGTAWLHSREEMDGVLDTLVIDEGGQFSLADALACGTAARRVVVLGDPLQLAQVTQGVHPPGSGSSVLEHVLGEHETIAEELGLFLEETRRMHPTVCRFVSDAFYESRLRSIDTCGERRTSDGVGVRWLSLEHEGNRVDSDEEAEAIAAEIERLVGHTFTDAGKEPRPIGYGDIMVVAPYNAQVRLLRERLPRGVEVGTVDKFQGREAVAVFYSMASSSGEDVPRGLDFLMSRNRLNVAVSRAQCLAYVVCSPRLLEVDCRTVAHLKLANALCSFVEQAHLATSAAPHDSS